MPARKRAKKHHGRPSRHKPAQRPRSTAELAAAFWRLIHDLNRALDGRHKPVWEAAETTS